MNKGEVYPAQYIFNWVATKEPYLQDLILASSLRASRARLIIEKTHSETIGKFDYKLDKTCCTCSYKFTNGCPLTTAVWSWLQTSQEKDWANQTRFGMVSEILSTHPSGKKDFCSSLRTPSNTQVGCTIQALNLINEAREAIASKKISGLSHSSWTRDI